MQITPFRILMKDRRVSLKLSQKELSTLTNITPALISRYENGLAKPRLETAKRIAKALNIDINTLIQSLEDKNEISLIKIPFFIDHDTPFNEDFFYIPSNLIKDTNNIIAYKQNGDSMSPIFEDGDILLIDRNQNDTRLLKDSSFLIILKGSYCGIKKISFDDINKKHIIHTVNPLYAPIPTTEEDLNIVGKVIWCGRYL